MILLIFALLVCVVYSFRSRKIFTFGELKHDGIQLRYIPDFISSGDCNHLISIARDGMNRSKVVDNGDNNTIDNNRTSYSFFLNKQHDGIVTKIENKVSEMLDVPVENIEALQVVRYQDGQLFNEHYDWFDKVYRNKINNQRQYTIFVYLNNVTSGGETQFPKLNLSFSPREGHALFWENCTSMDNCHDLSIHKGSPPKDEIKYGLNI